ncbi:MAG: histidinol dehydrogenase [Alphaproteobacteria bacterium]
MTINFYRWSETDKATKTKIMRRAQADLNEIMDLVRPIIADVKDRGDKALIEYARKFEGCELQSLSASQEDFERAEKTLDQELKTAIKHCIQNVRKFHEEQMRRVEKPWMVEIEPGVFAGEQISAIPSVGLYVPRGKGAFPSAMYMLALPAVIAGVEKVVAIAPPTPQGQTDDAYLYTARLCGVSEVYKSGGAQAIAALAYGTETIPAVKKVVGPSSPYALAAKRILSDIIDPGMPAGPSESIILADESAHPYNTCWDILNEAEHGEDSAALFITHDEKLARYVHQHLPSIIDELPEPHRSICHSVMRNYGAIILSDSLDHSIEIANEYAAEHLHLKVQNAGKIAARIKHAGEILLGEYTPSSLGNYGIGVNHVLPTGGGAHTYSCTSVWDFLKRTSLSQVTKEGFERLKNPVMTMTEYENFPAHREVLRKRQL